MKNASEMQKMQIGSVFIAREIAHSLLHAS